MQGYFLIPSGPFEKVHIPPRDEIFMAKGNTLHSGFALILVLQLPSFVGLAKSPYLPGCMPHPEGERASPK